jgi:hypothetical protein
MKAQSDVPGAKRGGRRIDPRLLMAGLFLLGLAPLLATPVLPLIDFYNHLSRFYVLSHIGASDLLQHYYQANWTLLPDIGVDIVGTPILAFVPPMIAGHIIAAGILAIIFSGVLYFNYVLTGRHSLLIALLLLPLSYSYILNWGFANFLLGLGLAFWAAGWWVAHRERPLLAVPVSCVFAVLIFLCHGLAFGLYGILVAFAEIGLFISAPVHRPLDLIRSLCLVAVQAIIPIAFFVWWMGFRGHGVVDTDLAAFSPQVHADVRLVKLVPRILKRLIPIFRVEEGPAYWFDIATFLIQAGAIAVLFWFGRVRIVRAGWPLIVAAMLTVGIGVPKLFGVAFITDRMPLFAALVLLGVLTIRPGRWNLGSRIACGVLIATVFVRLAAVAATWHAYDGSYREFRSVAAAIPRGSLVMQVNYGSGNHETDVPRCEMYAPMLVANYDQISWLFAEKDQQPLLLTGRLKASLNALHGRYKPDHEGEYTRYMSDAVVSGFDYLLVCNAHLLTQPFPSNAALVARTQHFALLRAKR